MALGLILSSSDFVYNGNVTGVPNYTGSNITGWPSGSAVLNSALSSPITNAGIYSRGFIREAVSNTLQPFASMYVSSSVDGGLYHRTGSNTFSTSKAYSVRAWMRAADFSAAIYRNSIGIILRGNPNNNGSVQFPNGSWQYIMGGYNIRLGGTDAYGVQLASVGLTLGTALEDGDDAGVPAIVTCDGTYAYDTWYRVRADVIPLGTSGDTINVYTSSAGDVPTGQETWDLVGTTFIDASADSNVYMTNRNDMGMGWYVQCAATTPSAVGGGSYIDQFEILVEYL